MLNGGDHADLYSGVRNHVECGDSQLHQLYANPASAER
ncbi:hypothetical protein KCO_12892 [Pectobacterium brasiliense ICMP 19477]|nr:hypothetical protein KCO_12892 [Pectobacterium brasiliense ICMP 19477]